MGTFESMNLGFSVLRSLKKRSFYQFFKLKDILNWLKMINMKKKSRKKMREIENENGEH